jgi:hypothetical protein
MTDRVKGSVFPVFDMSETVQTVLQHKDVQRSGGNVVARNGTDVFLYQVDDLAREAAQSGGKHQLQRLIHSKPARLFSWTPVGDSPDLNLPKSMKIESLLTTPEGGHFGFTLKDELGNIRFVVTKKWRCSEGMEIYIQLTGGPCPKHEDGILEEVL